MQPDFLSHVIALEQLHVCEQLTPYESPWQAIKFI